jgi:hypothetical protein
VNLQQERVRRRNRVNARQIADKIRWQTRNGARWTVKRILSVPGTALFEVKCIWRGFQSIFYVWKRWVTVADQTEVLREMASIARRSGLMMNTREFAKRDLMANRHKMISLIVAATVVAAVGVLTFIYGRYVLWGTLGGIGLIFEIAGHLKKEEEDKENPDRPITPLEPGVSIRKLQASIVDILETAPKPVQITFHGQKWTANGVELDCHTSDKITDEHIERLERHLQAGHGMISIIKDKKNAAAPILRLFWTDPLSGAVSPPRRQPFTLSCKDPFELTRTDDGGRGLILLLGNHTFIVGRSGSGKSSGLWTILNWLVDCDDADVDGIDLTNGPVFGAYRRVMRKVAYQAGDAHAILDEAIALAMTRNQRLNEGMDADDDGLADENWVVTNKPGERARFIVIDEYSTLAQDDALRDKVHRLLEVGRKARVHAVLSSPSPDKRSNKSTAPITQTQLKIVFGIPFNQIMNVLGPGSSDEGWRPDRFVPASFDNPHDSGKAYVQSGDHGRPIVHRFDRLTPDDIRERNRDRRAARKATIDVLNLPPVLKLLHDAFKGAGWPEKMFTETILKYDTSNVWDGKKIASALRDIDGIEITPKAMRVGDQLGRGYTREDLKQVFPLT